MKLLEQINLTGVQPTQMKVLPYMFLEEAESFTVDDSDVGSVVNPTMKVQRNIEGL